VEADGYESAGEVVIEHGGHGGHSIVDLNGGQFALQAYDVIEHAGGSPNDAEIMALGIDFHEYRWRLNSLDQLGEDCVQPPELDGCLAAGGGIEGIGLLGVCAERQERVEVSLR